jgi:hypothetical protein
MTYARVSYTHFAFIRLSRPITISQSFSIIAQQEVRICSSIPEYIHVYARGWQCWKLRDAAL